MRRVTRPAPSSMSSCVLTRETAVPGVEVEYDGSKLGWTQADAGARGHVVCGDSTFVTVRWLTPKAGARRNAVCYYKRFRLLGTLPLFADLDGPR